MRLSALVEEVEVEVVDMEVGVEVTMEEGVEEEDCLCMEEEVVEVFLHMERGRKGMVVDQAQLEVVIVLLLVG